jgi:hypothetical protein
MATIIHSIEIAAPAASVWDAVRDYGALHQRVAPRLVTGCTLVAGASPPVRLVSFANGMQLHETIVACDDDNRRLVWTITDDTVDHHNGSLQVFDLGDKHSRVTWTADVLPDSLAPPFSELMQARLATMAATLAG